MLLTINRTKWLSVSLVSLLLLTIISPFSVLAESQQPQVSQAVSTYSTPIINQQRYSDVPDTAWYAEAVNTWIMLGILNPKQGDKLNPQLVMTRGEFARFLAISLQLTPSQKASAFEDMPVDGELTGYVTALHDAGVTKGYPDGTFRPSLMITRAEVASFNVTAKKLKSEPQGGSQFHDVQAGSWYAGAIGALTKAGIASGKSQVSFAPNANIVQAEGIAFLYRSFFSPSIIQDISSDGTIKIDGQTYRAGASVQGIFQPSNKAALHNAAIQFTYEGDTIKSVEGLIIGYKDALTGMDAPIIFDAKGNTVNGTVIVSSNQVALAHLEVKGDLNLTPAVQSDFFAFNVLVQGKTVFLKDEARPKSQITNIWFEHSDLGQLFLFNSALVKKVDLSAGMISKSSYKSKGEVTVLAVADYTSQVQQLYVAYFNRPADAAGLKYWESAINAASGTVDIQVADSFAASEEYKATYAGSGSAPIVDQIYTNLFGRPADSASRGFWTASLDAGMNPSTGTGGNPATDVKIGQQIIVDNINSSVTASVNTELSTATSATLVHVLVQSGVSVGYLSQTPIGTLTIGNNTVYNAASDITSFTGSADIRQTIVNDIAGVVNLNVQGTIGSLQIAGDNPQIDLGDSTSITDMTVPSGVDPESIFVNGADYSRVKAVNGQSTTPTTPTTPTTNTDSSPSPSPSPSQNQEPNQNQNQNQNQNPNG